MANHRGFSGCCDWRLWLCERDASWLEPVIRCPLSSGAGMTGGITFLLDEDEQVSKRVNKEIVEIHSLSNKKQEDILKPLIHEHWLQTSGKAKE